MAETNLQPTASNVVFAIGLLTALVAVAFFFSGTVLDMDTQSKFHQSVGMTILVFAVWAVVEWLS